MSNPTPTIHDWGGETKKLLRFPEPQNKNWSAFNPSIAKAPNGCIAIAIRSSNYVLFPDTGRLVLTQGHDINSRLWFSDVSPELEITNLREVSFDHKGLRVSRGVEDARLIWRNDSWHFTAVMLEHGHTTRSRLCLYRLNSATNLATLVTKYDGPYPDRPEKNWISPQKATEEYDFIYGVTSTIKAGKLSRFPDADDHPGLLGLRGGSALLDLEDGTSLGVVHRVDITPYSRYNPATFGVDKGSIRDYYHRIARYDNKGRIISMTPEFIFDKLGVEYAAGLIQSGDNLVISYGSEDIRACLATVSKRSIMEKLVTVRP